MSRLRNGGEDHPEAADRHFSDSSFLLGARRVETAAYLAGYVVECCLKSVLIHDHAWDVARGAHDPVLIAARYTRVGRRDLGHRLPALATLGVGVEGARYLPDIAGSSVLSWRETLRYSAMGTVTAAEAMAWHEWAEHVYRETIVRMRLDGVL